MVEVSLRCSVLGFGLRILRPGLLLEDVVCFSLEYALVYGTGVIVGARG